MFTEIEGMATIPDLKRQRSHCVAEVSEPLRCGASAVVRQRGLGGLPHVDALRAASQRVRLPKGFPGIKHLASGSPRCSTWRSVVASGVADGSRNKQGLGTGD
jgi:hypothetical protein